MSAQDIREDLKAFIDGELSSERAATVERALSESSELRQEVEDMKRITQSLKAMAHGPAITGEAKAVDAVAPKGKRFSILALGAAAVVVCIAVAVGPRLLESSSVERMNRSMPASEPSPSEPSAAGIDGVKSEQPWAGETREYPDFRGSGAGGVAGKSRDRTGRPQDSSVKAPAQLPGNAIVGDDEAMRSVVRTASLTVKVDSAEIAERQVVALVKGWRGFVESSESGNLAAQNARITMAIRVPEKFFDDALQAFEKLGARTAKTISGQDVTSQLVDMGARLKNLRAQEDTYRNILRQTRRVGEVLEVQQRISDIRSEIESMDAQMQSLRKLAALASVSVTFEQRPSGPQANANDGGWASDVWASASAALGSAMKSVATAGIWVFVYAPIWLPLLFIGWALTKRLAVSSQ